MTTETITIVVNERGARVVKRSLEDIGTSAQKSQKGVDLLKGALATVGVGVAVRQLQLMIDSYTNLQNRLKLVTSGTANLNTVTRELFEISNSTRSSYEATAEVYARTALATKELGLSQRETLDFTKSLNQAVILSGASATESSAALIQLSQGMASGTLRGDELRSVLEQLPAVADVIAKGLGVTRGELRELGQEGKITATDIIESFKKAQDELGGNFAKTVPTIGQAFVVLKNNVMQFFGELDQATGISAAIAQGILTLSQNIDLVSKALLLGAGAWAAYWLAVNAGAIASSIMLIVRWGVAFFQLAATVRTASQAMALLGLVTMANPIAIIVTAIAAAIAAIILFRKEIMQLLRNIEFFGTNAVEVFKFLVDAVVGTFAGAWEAIKGFFNMIRVEMYKLGTQINDAFGRNLIPVDGLIGADVLAVVESAGRTAGENFDEGFRKATENGFLARELSRTNLPREVTEDTGINTPGAAIPTGSEGGSEAQNEALKRKEELLQSIIGPTQDFGFAISDLNTLYNDGLISLQEYNNAMASQEQQFLSNFESTTFAEGFISQLRRMQLETRNASAKMGEDFAKIFGPGGTLSKGIGDAVAQAIVFGKSWQESIRQVAQSILSQLISSLVQIGVNMLLNAVLGKTLMAASTAASAAAASATAAAWAPAAALASLASFGSNAAAAQAGIATTIATTQALAKIGGGLPGFESGGYTGNVGTKQIAGVVHGQEYVMNAAATARNRPILEAMNRGETAGRNGAGGRPVEISIVNEIPDAQFETNQLTEDRVEIIARRVVRQDAPGVIAGDISNPNSRTSKALSKNTQTQRRRS